MKKLIKMYNEKYGDTLGIIDDDFNKEQMYRIYYFIKNNCDDKDIQDRIKMINLDKPKTLEQQLTKLESEHNKVGGEVDPTIKKDIANVKDEIKKLDAQYKDIAKKIENVGQPTDTQISTAVNKYLTENPVEGSVDTIVDIIPDNNLFDKNNLVTSFTNKDNGTTTGNFTNYIKIEKGKKYITNLHHTQFYFFDENKVHKSTQTYISNPQIFDGNGGYVLIKLPTDYSNSLVLEGTDIDSYKPKHIKLKASLEDNKWYDKKWLLIGDSISTDESDLAKNGYGKLISRELGMRLTNIAVSGKTMSDAYAWLDNMSEKFDLITIMMGTNNQGYNCGIGSLNDSYYTAGTYDSNNSFYAQTQLMIEKLKTKYPKSVIILLTPIKRTDVGSGAKNDNNGYSINAVNKTTKEYRDVIIDCCNYYSIPYIDLYNTIDPRIESNRKLYFVKADGSDGTHPNDLGHALFLAPVIKDGIIRQCPYYFNEWNNGGEPDAPVIPTTYNITNTLNNATNSNSITSINKGASYNATITPDVGYEINNVIVTMGGVDITSTAYNSGKISISSVTGDIIITVTTNSITSSDYYEVQSEPNLLKNVAFSTMANKDVRTDYIAIEPNTPYVLFAKGTSSWLKAFTYNNSKTQLNTPPTYNISWYYIEPNENNRYIQIQAHSDDTSDLILTKTHKFNNDSYKTNSAFDVGDTKDKHITGNIGYFTKFIQTSENDVFLIHTIGDSTNYSKAPEGLYLFDKDKTVISKSAKSAKQLAIINADTKYMTINSTNENKDKFYIAKVSD